MTPAIPDAVPAVGPPVVYVVDDDSGMRQTVIDILALAGIAAEGFGSGRAAEACCGEGRPDLAVVDQRLPDTTGIALSASLKSADPDLGVILLTGYASTDNAIAAVGVADDYLTKPVPPDEFVRSVKAGLDRTRLRRENRQLVTRLQQLNASLEATVAQRTRELEAAHEQALKDQAIRHQLQAQAARQRLENRLHQAERLESLGQLAGGVAHDFNNLLAVILNCAAFVAKATADNESARADVEQIRAAAERAATLTRQLLIFGRREQARPEALDLSLITADLQGLLARSIGENIELIVHPGPGLPAVHADRGQIEQVLVNLVVNARDAMPDGGTLTIETSLAQLGDDEALLHTNVGPGRFVVLSVSDTGVGMSRGVAKRIFEPFFTTKPTGQGTGLGLATVHGIVTAAGGSLSVDSQLGAGTCIRAFFPAAQGKAAQPARPAASAPTRGNGETILIVEDEPAVLQVTARILRRNGYQVHTASTGAQALALASRHEFDLLLTDQVMPEMSGSEVAQRIGQIRPEAVVLFMSGYSRNVPRSRDTPDEDAVLLRKPFTEQTLLESIHAVLTAPGPAGPPAATPAEPRPGRSGTSALYTWHRTQPAAGYFRRLDDSASRGPGARMALSCDALRISCSLVSKVASENGFSIRWLLGSSTPWALSRPRV
jgi:signal transduction histidine kinase